MHRDNLQIKPTEIYGDMSRSWSRSHGFLCVLRPHDNLGSLGKGFFLLSLCLFADVEFTDKPGPATLAIGRVGRQVNLICCTANFAHISWQRRVNDTAWEDFFTADPDNRYF